MPRISVTLTGENRLRATAFISALPGVNFAWGNGRERKGHIRPVLVELLSRKTCSSRKSSSGNHDVASACLTAQLM
jgi:hypothetical protein